MKKTLSLIEFGQKYSLEYVFDIRKQKETTVSFSFPGSGIYTIASIIPTLVNSFGGVDEAKTFIEGLIEAYGRISLGKSTNDSHSLKQIRIAQSAINGCEDSMQYLEYCVSLLIALSLESMCATRDEVIDHCVQQGLDPQYLEYDSCVRLMDGEQNRTFVEKYYGSILDQNEMERFRSL